jgi:hypothetical protein
MLDRLSVLGNDGALPTITYKGVIRRVSFRTQKVLAAVEVSYRQVLQRQFLKLAKRTKDPKERNEILREAAKCLSDPQAITVQDLMGYMASPASLPAWIRAQVEGMEKANREEIKDFLQKCGTEFLVIFEGLKGEIIEATKKVEATTDPKAKAEILQGLGLL